MNKLSSDQPISVCFVCPKAYPLFNPEVKAVFGGAEVDLYYLATELAKDNNFDVSFVVADYGQKRNETREGVKLIKSLDFDRNPLTGAIKIFQAMKEADSEIYLAKTASPGIPLIAMFCRCYKKAFAYRTAHQYECDGTYIRKHFLLGRAFKISLGSAGIVFSQNFCDKENLLRTTAVDSVVIRNGHRIETGADSSRDSILWVGRSSCWKRPDLFIKLAREFADEKFVMICMRATDDKNFERYLEQSKKIGNLQFIEQVPFFEMEDYFKRAKVFVITSEGEGFPNTFIQAGKCGTAILSLNVNPDEFLDKNDCGVSCDDNWDKFIDSLRFMLAENRFVQMGSNARKYVEESHDIAKIAEQYKSILHQVLRKSDNDSA